MTIQEFSKSRSSYIGEIRLNWTYLFAATLGISFGYAINAYVNNVMSTELIREFGWSKAQFALLGATMIIGIVSMPVAGRLADCYGTKRVALVGVVASPLAYLTLSTIGPNFYAFLAVNILQVMIVGATTTTTVYSRLIAERFDRARGSALSILACSPPALAVIGVPLLNSVVELWGWRTGYLLLAIVTAVGGGAALLLLPRSVSSNQIRVARPLRSLNDYGAILNNPAFRIIAFAFLLCHLTNIAISTQLKLILIDRGIASDMASAMISLFAFGTILGRLCTGFTLDRFQSHIVAAVVLGAPGIGLLILGSGIASFPLLVVAILLIGAAAGAELDVLAYLIMRFFPVDVYGTAFGLVAAVTAVSSTMGSLLLSALLSAGGGFGEFFLSTSVTTFVGASLFLLLRSQGREKTRPIQAV